MISIDWQNFVEKFNRWVDRKTSQFQAGAKAVTAEAAKITNDEIRSSIREANAVASGNLLESVTIGSMRASTDMVEVTVGSSSPYARFVEHGRRAGAKAPPVNMILDWMVTKGLEPDIRAAYLIARKISRDGIPAKRVFERGIERAERKMNGTLDVIMDRSLEKD